MATSTQTLRQDHQIVLKVLGVTEKVAGRLERGDSVPPKLLENLAWFFGKFVIECQAGEEEDYLLPSLQKKDTPRDSGFPAALRRDHARARTLFQEMTDAVAGMKFGFAWAGGRWAKAARSFAELLRSHIDRENRTLLPMCEQKLTPEEQIHLAESFKPHELRRIGADAREHLNKVVEKLLLESSAKG
jgi:hemerythrin-like domain-containing protein